MTWLLVLEGLLAKMPMRPWRVEWSQRGEEALIRSASNELVAVLDGRELLGEKDRAEGIVALVNRAPELLEAVKALREVHEYQCGCDTPGMLDRCVAQPVVVFAALKSLGSE